MALCRRFGSGSVVDYGNGDKNHSRVYATHGLDVDAEGQAVAKMAECAFCLWAGLNPIEQLDWKDRPDHGWDVDFCGTLVDVKQTKMTSRLLMWPYNKVSIFPSKQFDVLALVKAAPPLFELAGWTTKREFACRHHVAPSGGMIHAGNWYLDQDELRENDSLYGFVCPGWV
jgi:hypothetical protein